MEQIKKFLHGKGFALVLAACLLAAAAAGVWAVRTVRDELGSRREAWRTAPEPEPDPDVGLEEEELWLDLPDKRQQRSTAARASLTIWLWFGARTLCLAHRLCTCRKLMRLAAVLEEEAQLQW